MTDKAVLIDYTNWRGERRWRKVVPNMAYGLAFMSTKWHPGEPQWMLCCIDAEDGVSKLFPLKDIHAWEPCEASHEEATTT